MLRAWLADQGRIVCIKCQVRAANLQGQVVTAHARITAIRESGAEMLVDLDIWTDNQTGQVMTPGTATVALDHAGTGWKE